MIAQLLYRDAGNYKTVVGLEVPEDLISSIKVGYEYQIEEFGKSEDWLHMQTGNDYDPELDHNLVEVEALYETMEEFIHENPDYVEKTKVEVEKVTETKYYLVNPDDLEEEQDVNDMSDEEFMNEAERQGNVYSQNGFVEAFNNDDFGSFNFFLRILTN